MALKLYFCDGCNESIPLREINEHRITVDVDAGRLLCSRCVPPKMQPTARAGGPTPVSLSLVMCGAVVVAALAWVGAHEIRDVEARSARLEKGLVAVEGQAASLGRDAVLRADADAALTKIRETLDGVRRAQDELAVRVRTVDETWGKSLASRDEAGRAAIAGALAPVDASLGDLRAQLAALTKALSENSSSIAMLDRQVAGMLTRSAADVIAAVPSTRPEAPPTPRGDAAAPDAELVGILGRLKNSDGMVRYAAVVDLQARRTAAAVAAVESALVDSESYVRDAAVRALRRMGAVGSVPGILRALRDEEHAVRASARDALKSLTGGDVAFDPDGPPADREARARDWDAFWANNRVRLLGGA